MSEYVRSYYPNGQLEFEEPRQYWCPCAARGWYANGQLMYEVPYQEDEQHGIDRGWHKNGELATTNYYLYGYQVTEEEFKKHELIEKLSGL